MARAAGAALVKKITLDVSQLHCTSVPSCPGVCVALAPTSAVQRTALQGTGLCGAVALSAPAGAVSLNENCDATVRSDMLGALGRIAATLGGGATTIFDIIGRSIVVPVLSGKLALGTWQGLYVFFTQGATQVDLWAAVLPGDKPHTFSYQADSRASHDITQRLSLQAGQVAVVHTHHTSASLCLRATALCQDLEPLMEHVVPDAWNDEFFEHTYEGRDDMPGHMKSTLLGCGCAVSSSLTASKRVLLNEHRDVGGYGCGHTRKVTCVVLHPAHRAEVSGVGDITSAVLQAAAGVPGGAGAVYLAAPGAQVHVSCAAPAYTQLPLGPGCAETVGETLLGHTEVLPLELLQEGQRVFVVSSSPAACAVECVFF